MGIWSKKYTLWFSVVEYLGLWGGNLNSNAKYAYEQLTLKDIQQSLNIIRAEIEKFDAETKMAALELIIGTSHSVVAIAKKLTKPKIRTKTDAIPKTKIARQQVAQLTKEKEPQKKPSIIKPTKPL